MLAAGAGGGTAEACPHASDHTERRFEELGQDALAAASLTALGGSLVVILGLSPLARGQLQVSSALKVVQRVLVLAGTTRLEAPAVLRRIRILLKFVEGALAATKLGAFASVGDGLAHDQLPLGDIIRAAVFLLEWMMLTIFAAVSRRVDKQLTVSLGAPGLEAKLALFAHTWQLRLLDIQQVSELLPRGLLLRLEVSARGHSRLQVS